MSMTSPDNEALYPDHTYTMAQAYILSSVKGSCTGSLAEVAAWQAEHQSAFARVDDGTYSVDVDDVDFDARDLDPAIARIVGLFISEATGLEVGDRIVANGDRGVLLAIGPAGDQPEHGMNATGYAWIGWDGGTSTWCPIADIAKASLHDG